MSTTLPAAQVVLTALADLSALVASDIPVDTASFTRTLIQLLNATDTAHS